MNWAVYEEFYNQRTRKTHKCPNQLFDTYEKAIEYAEQLKTEKHTDRACYEPNTVYIYSIYIIPGIYKSKPLCYYQTLC